MTFTLSLMGKLQHQMAYILKASLERSDKGVCISLNRSGLWEECAVFDMDVIYYFFNLDEEPMQTGSFSHTSCYWNPH